ncbi:hypothetical protein L1987_20199 [Smallanthus sonchifolius]|uniref:Uncharacterized protein n=1 Tax=Smallanthus sonchifolius TaxID=185202 RepID=A0ACB9IQR6_9ASTR|nr:hypothetical protein L1987_20199 [Smallanthus sonchifolius]
MDNKKQTLFVVLIATLITLAVDQGTRLGFYRTSCPRVETIVQSTVQSAIRSNPTMAPGAHTIGTAACALFSYRLYNYNNTNGPDPTIDTAFLPTLRNLCPNGGDGSRRVNLDPASVGRFDNSYYANLRNRRGVLESDAALWNDPTTQRFVQRFLGVRGLLGLTFNVEFGRSMIRMGNIEVKTGTQGEIRRVCSAIN